MPILILKIPYLFILLLILASDFCQTRRETTSYRLENHNVLFLSSCRHVPNVFMEGLVDFTTSDCIHIYMYTCWFSKKIPHDWRQIIKKFLWDA